MIARVCANTGWTWTYVREHVDLPTLNALQAEWSLHPPVHHLVASYLGYEAPVQARAQDSVSDIEEYRQELGSLEVRKVSATDTSAFDAQMEALKHG